MTEIQEQENASLLNTAFESGAKKMGERAVDRALNWMMDGLQSVYGGAQIHLGNAFHRYLQNAYQRYNQVRTLATGLTTRKIVGKNSIYVSVGVQYEKKEIDTSTVDALLRISNNILVQGTGGIGKSMLMRYLFLNTVNRGEYIPVLLELRRISHQPSGKVSILDLVYSCMKEFDVELPRESFEYSLRLGKYLFLMDGFDEIKEQQAAEAAEEIQKFCSKYPKNACIITSRPKRDVFPLETFVPVYSMPLNKEQAIRLASKIWKEDEKTKEFCVQLHDTLYDQHKDFAENPLLLSMMFLTFMRNNSIPNHLAEFYGKAYEALYSTHDGNDKGNYRREFKCKNLEESRFRRLLSHFCFQTFFKEIYEFSYEEILKHIENSIKKLGYTDICATDYLKDLRNVVCIIVEEGGEYRFSHRSFQTFFAACYTSEVLSDEQQKKVFAQCIVKTGGHWKNRDYYKLMNQLEHERFVVNALEDGLREVCEILDNSPNPDICILKLVVQGPAVVYKDHELKIDGYFAQMDSEKRHYYIYEDMFQEFVTGYSRVNYSEIDLEYMISCSAKVISSQTRDHFPDDLLCLNFEDIDNSTMLEQQEKDKFYEVFARYKNIAQIRKAIYLWLDEIDAKRAALSSNNFLDDL